MDNNSYKRLKRSLFAINVDETLTQELFDAQVHLLTPRQCHELRKIITSPRKLSEQDLARQKQAKAEYDQNRYRDNKEEITIRNQQYRLRNKVKFDAYRRNWTLNKKYNIDLQEYQFLMQRQHGKCVICGKTHREGRLGLHLDHCHKTGRVRGLLCNNCNPALGLLQDDIELLERAILYLKGELCE